VSKPASDHRVCYTDDFQGVVLGNFIRNDLSAQTAAVVFQAGDTYSIGLATSFADHYTQIGGHVVSSEAYPKAATDFSAIIDRLLTLKPQAVFVPGYARESGFFIKQARARGLESVLAGGDGWEIQMLAYGGAAVEGSYMVDHWHPGSTNPESRAFLAAFNASPFHTAAGVDTAAALAYDAFRLIVDAVKRADSDDPVLIRKALADTDAFAGVTGTIHFDAERNPVKSAVILRFGKKRIEYLKTIDP
jgi:branched-chain amino acid transport system substrate-binding protein